MSAITTEESFDLLTLPDLSSYIYREATRAKNAADTALDHAMRRACIRFDQAAVFKALGIQTEAASSGLAR